MQEIGHQLGGLFLQAVPTVLVVLLFYVILRTIFFKPLLGVMAEREARTAGARKAAEAAQAPAAEKLKQYQEALKQARARLYAEQEAARKKLLDERAALLKDARGKAAAEVASAKDRVAKELAAARRDLQATVAQLSNEIARRVLPAPPRPSSPAKEARCPAAGITFSPPCFCCYFFRYSAHMPRRKVAPPPPGRPRRSSSGSTLLSSP